MIGLIFSTVCLIFGIIISIIAPIANVLVGNPIAGVIFTCILFCDVAVFAVGFMKSCVNYRTECPVPDLSYWAGATVFSGFSIPLYIGFSVGKVFTVYAYVIVGLAFGILLLFFTCVHMERKKNIQNI